MPPERTPGAQLEGAPSQKPVETPPKILIMNEKKADLLFVKQGEYIENLDERMDDIENASPEDLVAFFDAAAKVAVIQSLVTEGRVATETNIREKMKSAIREAWGSSEHADEIMKDHAADIKNAIDEAWSVVKAHNENDTSHLVGDQLPSGEERP